MRWDALFEDLEAQLASAERLAVESEITERARIDQTSIDLADRLRGQLGRTLKVRVPGGRTFEGLLGYVGSEWMVLNAGNRSTLVPLGALQTVEGMGRFSQREESPAHRKLGMGSALRGLARDRAAVLLYLTGMTASGSGQDSAVTGTVDRVGKDFLELALAPSGELRTPENVAGIYTVPFAAIAAITSQH